MGWTLGLIVFAGLWWMGLTIAFAWYRRRALRDGTKEAGLGRKLAAATAFAAFGWGLASLAIQSGAVSMTP
jgi:hypothetical protein